MYTFSDKTCLVEIKATAITHYDSLLKPTLSNLRIISGESPEHGDVVGYLPDNIITE